MAITIKQLQDKSIECRGFCEQLVYFLTSTCVRPHNKPLFACPYSHDAAIGAGAISIHAAIEPLGIDDFGGDFFDRVVGGVEVVDLVFTVERFNLSQLQTALA